MYNVIGDNMNELGNLLKKLRGNKSLRDISKITGISASFLSSCERGKNSDHTDFIPSPDVLHKLSIAYNYSYVDLMTMAGYIPKTVQQSVDLLEKENELRIGDYVLNEEQKNRLLGMIRLMFPDNKNPW